MTNNEHEKVSALMDGDLGEREAQSLLEQMQQDSELRLIWRRYYVATAALRGDLGSGDVAGRISARLASEPVILAPGRIRPAPVRGAKRAVAGLAIAASVALVAIVAVRQQPVDTPIPPAPVAAVSQQDFIRASETRWSTREPGMESKLNMYLVEHNEFSPTSDIKGMIGFVQVVGYDNGK